MSEIENAAQKTPAETPPSQPEVSDAQLLRKSCHDMCVAAAFLANELVHQVRDQAASQPKAATLLLMATARSIEVAASTLNQCEALQTEMNKKIPPESTHDPVEDMHNAWMRQNLKRTQEEANARTRR